MPALTLILWPDRQTGGVIFPPVPAFYARPKSIDDLVRHTVRRVLDLFGEHSAKLARWKGIGA